MTESKETYSAIKHITFTVPGNPVPKERARVTRRGTYTPQRTKNWEAAVRQTYQQAQGPLFTGPVQVTMHFYRRTRHRADVTNMAKAIEDALNGIAWEDDSQIHREILTKSYDKNNPCVVVDIREWKEKAQ